MVSFSSTSDKDGEVIKREGNNKLILTYENGILVENKYYRIRNGNEELISITKYTNQQISSIEVYANGVLYLSESQSVNEKYNPILKYEETKLDKFLKGVGVLSLSLLVLSFIFEKDIIIKNKI